MKVIFIYLLVFFIQSTLYSAPKSVYDVRWDKYDNNNTKIIDHSMFNDFLQKYVKSFDGKNLVDYKNVTSQDFQYLNQYINKLATLRILSYAKQEQQAYWINLYNALTIKVILDTKPKKSIKESYGGILDRGPWDKKLLDIEGYSVSLNDIEHRILRPLWKDARVHFLVNCASIGCPNLLLEVITAANYEDMAEKAAKDFINSSQGVYLTEENLRLSSIFQWYIEDFGNNRTDLLNYLSKYSSNKNISTYKGRIYYEYDWDLNTQ